MDLAVHVAAMDAWKSMLRTWPQWSDIIKDEYEEAACGGFRIGMDAIVKKLLQEIR
jgi:hypothetical protein